MHLPWLTRSPRGLAAEPWCEPGSSRSYASIPASRSAFLLPVHEDSCSPRSVFLLSFSYSAPTWRIGQGSVTYSTVLWKAQVPSSVQPQHRQQCRPTPPWSTQAQDQMWGISLGSGPSAVCAGFQLLVQKWIRTVRVLLQKQDTVTKLPSVCRYWSVCSLLDCQYSDSIFTKHYQKRYEVRWSTFFFPHPVKGYWSSVISHQLIHWASVT